MLKHDRLIIGVPTYNEARFISQTLQSLKSQTYADFLVFIADNASTDGTATICSQFVHVDKRFHFVQHKTNMGAVLNHELLLRRTESPYFMWLGGHDVIDPHYIQTQLEIMDHNPDVSLAYSRVQWIDDHGAPVKITDGGDFLIDDSDALRRFIHATKRGWGECTAINGMIRRDALRDVAFHPVDGPDHLVLRSLQFFGRFHRTERALYMRRQVTDRTANYSERITGLQLKVTNKKRNYLPVVWHQIIVYFRLQASMVRKLLLFPSFLYQLHREYRFPKLLRRAIIARMVRIL